jgi:hypothetical protein
MPSAVKLALEDLLRTRRLAAAAPPLRGEDRRLTPLPTGAAAVDRLLAGGFPRGQVSEIHGQASSGRTGLALATVARATGRAALAAWIDPSDRLEPAAAATAGVDLSRLLWLRGGRSQRTLADAVSAVGALLGSGLFDLAVLDLAGIGAPEIRRLPGATWIRIQRMIEDAPAVLLLLADAHVAHGPAGISLALAPSGPRWSGPPGPGRLFRGLGAAAGAGRYALRGAPLELLAFS